MIHELHILDEGEICAFTVGGAVYPDQLLAAMRSSMENPALHASKAYLVDLSTAQLSHLSFRDLRAFAESRNEMRAMIGDRRPVAVFAPSALLYGLVRIIAVFDRAPIEVFRSQDDALVWLRQQIETDACGSVESKR